MKKVLIAAAGALIAVSVGLTGCGGGGKGGNAALTDKYGNTYPIETSDTLKVFCEFPENALKGARNMNDLPLGKQVEKETGIKIEYIHPSDNTGESFNLMLASGELPDIIMSRWCQFAGGGDKAVSDGYILELNEIVDKYCPDFKAALKKYNAEKYYSTDDGKLFFFPGLWNYESVNTSGFMLRKDWLDELGLAVPETIDEWETVLRAFKEKKGAVAPFSSTNQPFGEAGFSGAYGIKLDYYIDGGKVKNGYMEPEYKELLKKIISWRDEGLFDKNFTTADTGIITTNMLTGKSGATFGAQGSLMGNLMGAATEEGYDLIPAPFPTLKKGEKCNIAKKNTQSVAQMGGAITTQCKNVELAARWLNYGYTEQGHLTYAFGIEGESYTIENGEPIYTDLIKNNSEGISMKNMLDRYTRSATSSGSFIKDFGYLKQYAKLDCQQQALKIWSDQDGEGTEIPPLFFKDDEKEIMSKHLNALKTYQQEMFYKFINKEEPIENFDKYIKTLEGMGANDVLETYQRAYDRYLKR